jgi:hypothetical protein
MRERDELRRAHIEIARLRELVAELERALRTVSEAVAPFAQKNNEPLRKQIGSTDSGQPIYADEDDPGDDGQRTPDRRSQWRHESEPRPDDGMQGGWSRAELQQMDENFKAAVIRAKARR